MREALRRRMRTLEVNAGIARCGCGFSGEGELPHFAVAGAVVDLQHRLRVDVTNDVLAFAIHAAQRNLAARHDRQLVPAKAASRRHTPLPRDLDLTGPI